jgi:capsular polysaccharide biosynthesis protein
MVDKRKDIEDTASEDETEIDLGEVAAALFRKWYILLLALIIGGGVAFGYTQFFVTPKYTATAIVYVYNQTSSTDSGTLSELQVGSQLATDFENLATTRSVVGEAIDNCNLDSSYETVLKQISVENPENTRILKLSVTDTDAKTAMKLSNAWAEALSEKIASVISTNQPGVVDPAVEPDKPSSPSLSKNTMIGALLCFFLAAAYITIEYIRDDTIKTSEDVTKYLGVSTLAAIPLEHFRDSDGKKKKRVVRKKK